MKKIIFILKNNDEIIIENELNAIVDDNTIKFNYKNEIIKVKYDKKNIEFNKTNDSEKFYIGISNGNIISYLYLKEQKVKFDIKVLDFSYIFNENYLKINYKIETDEHTLKTIEIKFK